MQPLIFAHRGARSLAPENTLAAIEKAWNIGTDGVEVDVRASRDGELFLFHDEFLARTTNAPARFPGRVGEPLETFNGAQLELLDAGSWFEQTDPFGQIRAGAVSRHEAALSAGLKIPRLRELLDFSRGKSWRLNLELKPRPAGLPSFPLAETVIRLLEEERVPPETIIISSFDHRLLRAVERLNPAYEINALIGSNPHAGNDWGAYEFPVYNANAACIDEQQVGAAVRRGCRVNLYTVNEPHDMLRFGRWGVHTIITDFPQRMLPPQRSRSVVGP